MTPGSFGIRARKLPLVATLYRDPKIPMNLAYQQIRLPAWPLGNFVIFLTALLCRSALRHAAGPGPLTQDNL